MSRNERRERPRRGAYLMPSLFTIGNILLGFYAVVRGLRGDLETAALMILGAALLDTLDGGIARLTGTESAFGREFDSLADVLTFGAAPAWLAYEWGLAELGRPGWLVPLFYLVCCAIRLARFNVQAAPADHRWFVGLPAPAAGLALASLIFFAPERDRWEGSEALFLVALLALGALMVSTFRYSSFKRLDLRRRWSYRAFLPIAALLLVVAYRPTAICLALAVLYTLSAPLAWAWGKLRPRRLAG